MPFLKGYKDANKLLDEMKTGVCDTGCRKVWMPHIKKALVSKTNPLKLNKTEKKKLDKKVKDMKGKRFSKTVKQKK